MKSFLSSRPTLPVRPIDEPPFHAQVVISVAYNGRLSVEAYRWPNGPGHSRLLVEATHDYRCQADLDAVRDAAAGMARRLAGQPDMSTAVVIDRLDRTMTRFTHNGTRSRVIHA